MIRRIALGLVFAVAALGAHGANLSVYTDSLQSGFTDYGSWAASYSFADTTQHHTGAASLRFKPDDWGGVRVRSANAGGTYYRFADYASLTLWVNGGSGGGQLVDLHFTLDDIDVGAVDITSHVSGGIAAGQWRLVTIDFDTEQLVVDGFNGFFLQAHSYPNATQPTVFFDDIVFNQRGTPIAAGASVNVSVDKSADVKALHPEIFGVAFGDAARNAAMGYTVRRWGGNSVTRYNWRVDVNSTAADYFYENIPGAADRGHVPPTGNAADAFVTQARSAGAEPLITIPTIGFAPRDNSPQTHPFLSGFNTAKYGPQNATDPYDAPAGNGECDVAVNTTINPNNGQRYCQNGLIVGNDPTDTSFAVPPQFYVQWINHFQTLFGSAANGGVKLYALDNEVMLWDSTHRDIHPLPPTYDEIWSKTFSYANAIKSFDGGALITGPVTWGYPDLFTSAKDAAECDCLQGSDRSAHGGDPFVLWYLKQVQAHPFQDSGRLVDYLDLHYYPQGGVALETDETPITAARRLRSVKELYDPNWVSESWMADLGDDATWHYSKPQLIPRVRAWIDQYAPGTKLAITEYNWGRDQGASATLAQTEVLAIFAREGVDLATRWVAPEPDTRAERAFQIFRNYDGAGAQVLGDSVRAVSGDVNAIGAYAFRLAGQRVMVLLINKSLASHAVNLSIPGAPAGAWKLYRFDALNPLALADSGSVAGGALVLGALPARSANLLVLGDDDTIFANGFETP